MPIQVHEVWENYENLKTNQIDNKNPGAPYGTRTRVFAVRGRRPGPLDEGSKGERLR
jgi:hypothetical protein